MGRLGGKKSNLSFIGKMGGGGGIVYCPYSERRNGTEAGAWRLPYLAEDADLPEIPPLAEVPPHRKKSLPVMKKETNPRNSDHPG